MREWKVTNGYKVKADELSWEELKNATENVIEEKRKSHRFVVRLHFLFVAMIANICVYVRAG